MSLCSFFIYFFILQIKLPDPTLHVCKNHSKGDRDDGQQTGFVLSVEQVQKKGLEDHAVNKEQTLVLYPKQDCDSTSETTTSVDDDREDYEDLDTDDDCMSLVTDDDGDEETSPLGDTKPALEK